MLLLAIDTSGKTASVALVEDGRLLSLVAPGGDEQHSVALFRSIEKALSQASRSLADIDLYAVANGPGAFTGLRVGLTVVKGLAEMHTKPVVPVSVLEAVAESGRAGGWLVPLVDAYRDQIFGGLYERTGDEVERRGPERVLGLEEFLKTLAAAGLQPERCTVVSPQMERWAERLGQSSFARAARESVSPPLAAAVARRALKKFARGEALDALALEASYVRRSDAELLWKGK